MKKNGKIKRISATLGLFGLTSMVLAGEALYEFGMARNGIIKWKPSKKHSDEKIGRLPFDHEWINKNCEEIKLTNTEGMTLNGYFKLCPGDSHKYVITCHGYRSNASMNGTPAQKFYEMGYGILAPDARGHGKSDGKYIGMGWHERRDIVEWAKLLVSMDPDAEIVLFGVSMGGATVMCTSGEADLPSNVRAVIEDCGFCSTYEEFSHELKCFGVPKHMNKLILEMCRIVTIARAGYDFKKGSALEQLAKSKLPTLFIHGGKDNFVPTYMVEKNYAACAAPKEKIVIDEATHAISMLVDPEKYWSTVKNFLKKWM